MSADSCIYILTGPTAVGKTELALRWAEAKDAEIVSADSLLFYRGMDIGTAKPSLEERARVPHHMIDIVPVSEPLDITRYVELALETVRDIQSRGKRVLVTGGSGFYLKAFYAPVADDTDADPAIRKKVQALEKEGGLGALLQRLEDLNPDGLGKLDTQNPRRVARALERCLISGKTLIALERDFAASKSPFHEWKKQTILLDRSRESQAERIARRTATMLEAGLLEEVKALKAAGILENPSAARAIGYREPLAWMESGGSLDDLQEAINVSTRQLVAKQHKWFRHQLQPDRVIDLDTVEPNISNLFS